MNSIQPHPTMPNYRKLLTPEEFREIVAKGETALIQALSRYVRETGGRKATGNAMTGSERVALYRKRKREREQQEKARHLREARLAGSGDKKSGGAKGRGRGKG